MCLPNTAADEASLEARAQWIRQYLRARPEEHIVVVAHGDILRRITNEPYPWTNAEVRLFQFDPSSVSQEHCHLFHVKDIAAGGRTDAELAEAEADQGTLPVNSTEVLPVSSEQNTEPTASAKTALASIEQRVKDMYVKFALILQPSIGGLANYRARRPRSASRRSRSKESCA